MNVYEYDTGTLDKSRYALQLALQYVEPEG